MTAMDTQRTEFLDGIRKLTIACFQRASVERVELCCEQVEKPEEEALERYAKLRVRISNLTQMIRQIEERAKGTIGVLALLNGVEPEPPVRIAACLLLARAIADSV